MPLFSRAVDHSQSTFQSEGQSITIEQFLPEGDGPFAAVLALHGSGGLHGSFGEPARMLAGSGFAVFIPHYFERTGTTWADDTTARREFPVWMRTIADAVTHVAAQSKVDGGHIGLLGFSLGAYLALSVATQDQRIRAVVEYFGGIPEELVSGLKRMPPVLILHGEADPVVPVAEAHKLESVLKNIDAPFEIKIYRGAGHSFSGLALLDSAQRTLSFLQRHLG